MSKAARGAKKRPPAKGEEPNRFKVVAVNRLARHDYDVLRVVEAGIVLLGTEVKSIRAGRANIRDAFARRTGDGLWLYDAHIPRYAAASYNNHEPLRPRKLLLHKEQIHTLALEAEAKRLTLVPLRLYIKDHHAKIELALVKGRKEYDKRDVIAKRDSDRRIQQALKQRE